MLCEQHNARGSWAAMRSDWRQEVHSPISMMGRAVAMVNRAGLLPRAHACEGAGEKLHCQRAGLLQWSRCLLLSLAALSDGFFTVDNVAQRSTN